MNSPSPSVMDSAASRVFAGGTARLAVTASSLDERPRQSTGAPSHRASDRQTARRSSDSWELTAHTRIAEVRCPGGVPIDVRRRPRFSGICMQVTNPHHVRSCGRVRIQMGSLASHARCPMTSKNARFRVPITQISTCAFIAKRKSHCLRHLRSSVLAVYRVETAKYGPFSRAPITLISTSLFAVQRCFRSRFSYLTRSCPITCTCLALPIVPMERRAERVPNNPNLNL